MQAITGQLILAGGSYRALGGPFFTCMLDVMCVVTNHGGKRVGLLFRVDSGRLFVMSDAIFIVIFRD